MVNPGNPPVASFPIPPPVAQLPIGQTANGTQVFLSEVGLDFLQKLWAAIQGQGGIIDQGTASLPSTGQAVGQIESLVAQAAGQAALKIARPENPGAVRKAIQDAMLLARPAMAQSPGGGGGGGGAQVIGTVKPTGTNTVSFTIPAAFNHIQLIGSGRTALAASQDQILLTLNSDVRNSYVQQFVYGLGGTAGAQNNNPASSIQCGLFAGNTAQPNTTGSLIAWVINAQQLALTVEIQGTYGQANNTEIAALYDGYWGGNIPGSGGLGAVNTLTVKSTGNYVAGTIFSCYGWP